MLNIGKCTECIARPKCARNCESGPNPYDLMVYMTSTGRCIDCGGADFLCDVYSSNYKLTILCRGCRSRYILIPTFTNVTDSIGPLERSRIKGKLEGEEYWLERSMFEVLKHAKKILEG